MVFEQDPQLVRARELLAEARKPGLRQEERRGRRIEATRLARSLLSTAGNGSLDRSTRVGCLDVVAEAAIESENWETAWWAVDQLLGLNGSDPRTQYLYGLWLSGCRRYEEAAARLGEAVALGYEPRSRADAERAFCVASAGRKQEGLILAESAVQLYPSAYYPQFIRGWILAEMGHALEAVEAYQKAVELDSTDVNLLGFLSMAWESLGDFDKAFAVSAQICQVQPGWDWCRDRMAVLLDRLGPSVAKAVQASKLLREAAKMPGQTAKERSQFKFTAKKAIMSFVPAGVDAANWITNADLLREYNELALVTNIEEVPLKVAARLLKMDPENAENNVLMARSYAYVENHAEAVHYYQKALDLGVADPAWTRTRYAYSLGMLQRYKEAHEVVDEAMRIAPNFHKGPFTKGWLYEMQMKTDDAIDWYQKATRLYDKDADVWAFLGDLYEERKENGKAVECFKKLLEAKPDDRFYAEKLRELEAGLSK